MNTDSLTIRDTIKVDLTDLKLVSDTLFVENSAITKDLSGIEYFSQNLVPIITLVLLALAIIISYSVYYITKNHNKKSLKQNREHNELSLDYYLIFRANTNHRLGKIKLWISNKGLGPCIFEKFEIEYDAKIYYSMIEVFNAINSKQEFNFGVKDFKMDYRLFSAPLKKYGLTPNENKTLIKYQLINKDNKTIKLYYEEYKKIIFRYRTRDFYEKIRDDKFEYNKDYDIKNEGHIE